MSGKDVEDMILTPMQGIFVAPREYKDEGSIRAALGQYVSAMEHFDRQDLGKAWEAVRNAQTARAWPMPGVFVQAASRARLERMEKESPEMLLKRKQGTFSPSKAWQAAVGTAAAKDAARRGVAWSFKMAVLGGDDPRRIDLDSLEDAQQRARVLAGRLEDGKEVYNHRGESLGVVKDTALALDMWRQLQVREAETQQEIGIYEETGRPKTVFSELV